VQCNNFFISNDIVFKKKIIWHLSFIKKYLFNFYSLLIMLFFF
jgi:hypothetical protein